jgi:plastocyanin
MAAVVIVTGLVAAAPAAQAADELSTLTFRNHRFEPSRIEVPAGVKFKLKVHNADDTADEFESTELNREKLVAAGQTITVFLGPLQPGEYKFFGDFHQDTAQGVLVAK